jgi:hypothetical protein
MKEKAIECISELIYQTTSNQEAYDNRIKGFIAEALASDEIVKAKGYLPLKGGWIIPLPATPRFRDTVRILYLTILHQNDFDNNIKHYCAIYNELEKFDYKYLATYTINFNAYKKLDIKFSTIEFPEIKINYYKFNSLSVSFDITDYNDIRNLQKRNPPDWKKQKTHKINKSTKNILNQLSKENLYDILSTRYVFDYLLGNMYFGRGIPSDFDMIVYFPDQQNNYVIYEIKEKDQSKKNGNINNVVGFGMDIERINDYDTFIKWFPQFDFRYLVREINNQKDRKLVGWRSINMKEFIKNSIYDPDGKSGGQGMLPSTLGSNDIKTAICPIDKFKII